MPDRQDWNRNVIEEFHANGGKVGGNWEGRPLLLLHTIGARSGKERVNPLMYQQRGDDYVVFATKGGAPSHPDWYFNLLANPAAQIEVGDKQQSVRAHLAEGDEREELWEKQKEQFPNFAEYERKTSREIPVVVLEPES